MSNSFIINLGKFKKAGLASEGSAAPVVLTSDSGFDALVRGSFKFNEYPAGSGTQLLGSIEVDLSELASEILALDNKAIIVTNVTGNIVNIGFNHDDK